MKTFLHRANSRGHANHGWLDSYHSFSFADYYNPQRINFGALRVLNDDSVAPGAGFGTHPHQNMEIVSIPLAGDLEHKDSMGNVTHIKEGEVQVLSAGTGITHSEYNKNQDKEVKFLQIWIHPDKQNVEPRYDQVSLRDVEKENDFYQILSPNQHDAGVWIHQNAWFHLGKFASAWEGNYSLKGKNHGVYAFILSGNVNINGTALEKRDAFGVWECESLKVVVEDKAEILLMEVPMQNYS